MRQQLRNKRHVPIAAVYRRRTRITIDRKRVHYALNTNITLKRIVRRKVYIYAEIAKAHTYRVINSRCIRRIGVTRDFNLPD